MVEVLLEALVVGSFLGLLGGAISLCDKEAKRLVERKGQAIVHDRRVMYLPEGTRRATFKEAQEGSVEEP